MPSRFEQLRDAIANLAAPADQQDQHLTNQGFTADYGNDELALEFDDIFHAARLMEDAGELTPGQREAASPLDDLLKQWSGSSHANFWRREALWSDTRWDEVRRVAREALTAYTK
jgi:hypothetical protein